MACLRLKSSEPRGSSNSRTAGRLISARASATRCLWPPLRSRGNRSASSVISIISSMLQTDCCRSAGDTPRIFKLNSTFWNTDRCGKSAKLWNIIAVSRSEGGKSVTFLPVKKICPDVTSSRPPIMRSVVVLPQPLGPSMATNSPCSISALKSITAFVSPANVLQTSTKTTSRSAISNLPLFGVN